MSTGGDDRRAAAGSARGEEESGFTLELSLRDGYVQAVDFGLPGVEPFVVDEPPPLGESRGPNPARVLGAAVGSCLGASLLFCLRKARIDVLGLRSQVTGTTARNERGRLRVQRIDVRLEPFVPADQHERMSRCLEIFEDFCVVTGAVRQGVDVRVEVVPQDGSR